MAKKYFIGIFLFLLIFINFSSALESYGTKELNKEFSFCQVCSDATYITLSSIETPNSTISIRDNMTSVGSGEYCYNYTPNLVGRYDFRGISDGCEKTFATYLLVSADGKDSNIQTALIQILLIFFFIGIGLYFYILSRNIDLEKMDKKIFDRYQNRNYIKLVFSSIGYNILKNSFIIYYLIGLPILTIITDLSRIYNLTDITSILSAIVVIYTIGIILVGIFFIGKVQEWLVDLFNKLKDMQWGLNER